MALSSSATTATADASRVDLLRWLSLFLFGATPVLFALATCDPALADLRLQGARSFGTPVLAIETAVVVLAVIDGWTVRGALALLDKRSRLLLAALTVVAMVTSAFVAIDKPTAVARTGANLIHIVFGFACAHLLSRRDLIWRRLLWPAVVAGLAGYTLLTPFYLAAIPDRAAHDWLQFGLAVVNVRQVGFYALVGAAASLGLAIVAADRRTCRVWIASAAVFIALASWSGTRGAIVALLASAAGAATLTPRLRTARALYATLVSVLAGILVSLPLTAPDPLIYGLWRMSATLAPDVDVTTGRVTMWIETLQGIAKRPLFGHGESQFRLLIPASGGMFNHPHNAVLQIGLQWGAVGLSCVAGLAWPMLARARRAAAARPEEAAPALLVLLALLVMSLFEGALYHAYPIMMVALSMTFLLTLSPGGIRRDPNTPRPVDPASPRL